MPDRRKYDSPLLFREGEDLWLIGRRNVTDDGFYDLDRTDLEPADRYLNYQFAYWNEPKRCALWSVDPDSLLVTWVLDLPSRGDTCFPEALPLGEARWDVWNYSSDVEGPDHAWQDGQVRPTHIYRMTLGL